MSSDVTDVGGAIARPSMTAALYAGEYPAPHWDHDYWLSWWEELSHTLDDYIKERVAGTLGARTTEPAALHVHGGHG